MANGGSRAANWRRLESTDITFLGLEEVPWYDVEYDVPYDWALLMVEYDRPL